LVILIISFISASQLNSLLKYSDQVAITDKVINLLSQVEIQLLAAESSQRGFLVTKDSTYLVDFLKAPKTIYGVLDSLRKVIPDEEHKQDLIKIKYAVATRLQILQETLDYAVTGNKQEFKINVAREKLVMEDFKMQTSKFQKEQVDLMMESEASKRKYEIAAPIYVRVIFLLSMIFHITAFILIVREFRRRHQYQKDLERKIKELNMSHAELEQIAFIASHDLQEPLRKMRTFGGRLLMQYKDSFDEDGRMMLSRIDFAARRMQGLIEDLVDYTHLINSNEEKQKVDLNSCIEEVQNSLANVIQNKSVEFSISELPVIEGYPFQLRLLFTNLFHNSIKFSKQDQKPFIEISSEQVEGDKVEDVAERSKTETYMKVSIKDNGIGFDNEFGKKIFVLFQRLHNQNSSYGGKGIGLSICKRVMTNHNGFIAAEGEPAEGATFNVYFPL
jgi:signal transduction histidine kinase/type II secretory pathway pseudopilin PulG